MNVVFGLGTRLHARAHTYKIRLNGVLCNGQQLGSAVNSFFDQDKSEAMKTLSGLEAVRCDEHQFRAKIKASYHCLTSAWSEQRIRKMALLLPHTFALAVFRKAFGQLYESC